LLLVRDRKVADQLAPLIEAATYAASTYTDTLQGALELLACRPFGVVILDDHLRQGSGLQALARLRERYPALPIIMVSAARCERTAIDAFHLGVTDYIPKEDGYGDLVAALVAQLAAQEPLIPQTRLLNIPKDVPVALLAATYQNRLRVIGGQCDAAGLRELAVLETAGGFVVRAVSLHDHRAEVLEFANAHFAQLVGDAITARGTRSLVAHPLLPTGYEDAWRAIGRALDEREAKDVTIVELEQRVVVSGRQQTNGYHESSYERFEWMLEAEDLKALVDQAFYQRDDGRRAHPASSGTRRPARRGPLWASYRVLK
jgi:DNA-binding response OmpR family regulator